MPLTQLNVPTTPLDESQLDKLHEAIRELSASQLIWISGYLAALGQPQPHVQQVPHTSVRLTVLYGSQTGNARGVAELLGERAVSQGLDVRVLSTADFRPRDLTKEQLVLLVVSTHGEGEPPDSALALYRFLHAERAPRLEHLRYAVLGLGDSSYEHFNQAARDFDRRLTELGARVLTDRVDADVDYGPVAERWGQQALARAAELMPGHGARVVALPGVSLGGRSPTKDRPYRASLLENRRITTADAVSDVRHLVLGVDPGSLRYRPGDSLGVWLQNDPELVDAVLRAACLDGNAPVDVVGGELSLRQALSEKLELTRLHPSVVRGWAELARDRGLSALVNSSAEMRAFIRRNQFLDLVVAHPAPIDALALGKLLKLLKPLQPRLYSIASSQDDTEDELHLTVSVLRYHATGRDHLGAASGFLAERLDEGQSVPVYVAENPAFRLPADGDTPVIMIGAGTGIAPYRGFLQHRAANGHGGHNWLVFGNRHFHRDFLYQTDWISYRKRGLLHRVSLAFSRDGPDSYVQHRLREQGGELHRWLEEGAHLYVCGSTAMGEEVHRTLIEIVASQAGQDLESAQEVVARLQQDGRYHRDTY